MVGRGSCNGGMLGVEAQGKAVAGCRLRGGPDAVGWRCYGGVEGYEDSPGDTFLPSVRNAVIIGLKRLIYVLPA
jgi:hypothetical protein